MPQFSELIVILAKTLDLHKARLTCLTHLLVSLFKVNTVNLTKIALGFGGEAQIDSRYRRLKRFFAEVNFDYLQVAKTAALIANLPPSPWVLIFDRTRWDLGKRANNVLVLSVGLGDTAVPLFWKNIDKRGNSHADDRRELLERFFRVFGQKKIACVLGDREFASQEFMRYLQQLNILFAIRVKDNSYAINAKGQRVKLKNCCRRVAVYDSWTGLNYQLWGNTLTLIALRIERDLIVLATTLPSEEALALYERRWEIETSFAALKKRGFCLTDTHMTKIERTEKWSPAATVTAASASS